MLVAMRKSELEQSMNARRKYSNESRMVWGMSCTLPMITVAYELLLSGKSATNGGE